MAKFSKHDFYVPASSGNGELIGFVGGSVSPQEYLKLNMPSWRGVMDDNLDTPATIAEAVVQEKPIFQSQGLTEDSSGDSDDCGL